jgi:hypothetical protein
VKNIELKLQQNAVSSPANWPRYTSKPAPLVIHVQHTTPEYNPLHAKKADHPHQFG